MSDIDGVIGGDPGGKGCGVLITREFHISFCEFRKVDKLTVFERFQFWSVERKLLGFRENVANRPGEGSSSTLAFGRSIQFLEDCFIFNRIPQELVAPASWQCEFGVFGIAADYERKGKTRSEAKTLAKKEFRRVAQEIFPNVDMTLERADATLIAVYGWRKTFGGLTHGKDPDRALRTGTGLTRIVPSPG